MGSAVNRRGSERRRSRQVGSGRMTGPTLPLLLLSLVTVYSVQNYSCAADEQASCKATGTCTEGGAHAVQVGGAQAEDEAAKRERMRALAAEINDSINQRQQESKRWESRRASAQREERALHEAQKRERKRTLRQFYEQRNKPEKVAEVDNIIDNFPFNKVVESLLKVYKELPQGWSVEQGAVSEDVKEAAWKDLYGGGV